MFTLSGEPFFNSLDFYEENSCKKKKVRKNCFDKQEKS